MGSFAAVIPACKLTAASLRMAGDNLISLNWQDSPTCSSLLRLVPADVRPADDVITLEGHSISSVGENANAPTVAAPMLQCTQTEVWPLIWKHNVAVAKAVMDDGFLRCST